ncbi:MAG: MBL fold metallo-hydrolase [Proteobacteria bacterium]|nr:MBL fold metallo-hydrolase [Pseudomonadota bacterium]
MSIEKVTESIYANIEYDGGNVACIDTSEGVVLVDTPMLPKDIAHWKDFVLNLNPKGVKYLINTHIHFDHIVGARQLGGTVVMHEKMREMLFEPGATLREDMAGMMPGRTREEVDFILNEALVPSEITMSDELTLNLGDRTLKLVHLGGHTVESIVVYSVEDRVLIAGDNITAARHPYKGDAVFADWMTALQKMKSYDIERIVPGHGEVCGREEVDRFIDYFQGIWNITNDLVAQDRSLDDIVQRVHQEMFGFFDVDPEMIEGSKMMFDMGTRQLCKELKDG